MSKKETKELFKNLKTDDIKLGEAVSLANDVTLFHSKMQKEYLDAIETFIKFYNKIDADIETLPDFVQHFHNGKTIMLQKEHIIKALKENNDE